MRRRAVAPVKIDPPHSFPTFSPREVRNHERMGLRGWWWSGVGPPGWPRWDGEGLQGYLRTLPVFVFPRF